MNRPFWKQINHLNMLLVLSPSFGSRILNLSSVIHVVSDESIDLSHIILLEGMIFNIC